MQTVKLIYVDDSGDDDLACFSAIMIDAVDWPYWDRRLQQFRRAIKEKYGIFNTVELHGTSFLNNRGKVSDQFIDTEKRVYIVKKYFQFLVLGASEKPIQIFNCVMRNKAFDKAFEWLLNRLNTNLEQSDSYGIIVSDEGKSYDSLLNEMRKKNEIPSFLSGPGYTVNVPVTRIIDKISYRKSHECNFIQAADLCAYALLRKEKPLPRHLTDGVANLFYELENILVKKACSHDPYGIIRAKR